MIVTGLAARIRWLRPRRHEPSIEEVEGHGVLLGPEPLVVIMIAVLIVVEALTLGLLARFLLT
ncbi:MAG: hypothetical protein QOH97_1235 [Actinoplanes sp.]|jgi:hypothetical protein|nr:hypothetical protein [Actinoplanes sp.]